MPPIYFSFDSANPTDGYYLVMEDATVNPFTGHGNELWTVNDYNGVGAGGGGGVVTDFVGISNMVVNNIFWNPAQSLNVPFATSTNLRLAPSSHDNFVEGANANGPTGPDIVFAKNNTNATDTLEFVPFAPGDTSFAPDVTPPYYLEYACTVLGGSETYKYVQFPITAKVQNLQDIQVTAKIYGKVNAGNPVLTVSIRQFFGDGGGSPDAVTTIGSFTLTSAWEPNQASAVIPGISGKTLGSCGNDAVFLQIGYPLSAVSTIGVAKLQLYIGANVPPVQFETNDQIDAVTMTPRVGDIKTSLSSVVPLGYLPMNNGTIGNPSSNATVRANIDTFALFNTIWQSVHSNPTYAPIYTSAGVLSTFTDAISDFDANKQLSLTKQLGQVMAGISTILPASQTYTVNIVSSTTLLTLSTTTAQTMGTGTPVVLSTSGTVPTGLSAGVVYYATYVSSTTIKLSSSLDNVAAGVYLAFTGNGTGVNQIQVFSNGIGLTAGSATHVQTLSELVPHTHTVHTGSTPGGSPPNSALPSTNQTNSFQTDASTGAGIAFNIMQPTTFLNVFIKY